MAFSTLNVGAKARFPAVCVYGGWPSGFFMGTIAEGDMIELTLTGSHISGGETTVTYVAPAGTSTK